MHNLRNGVAPSAAQNADKPGIAAERLSLKRWPFLRRSPQHCVVTQIQKSFAPLPSAKARPRCTPTAFAALRRDVQLWMKLFACWPADAAASPTCSAE